MTKIYSNKFTSAIEVADTTKMANEDWQVMRSQGDRIGGSDQAVIMNCSPFKTAKELADEKMGIEPKIKRQLPADALETGHVYEAFVAMNFLRKVRSENPSLKIRLVKDFFRDFLPYTEGFFAEKPIFTSLCRTLDKIYDLNRKSWDINPNGYFQCGQKDENGNLLYPFAYANIDGIVEEIGKDGKVYRGIFEAKTTNYCSAAGKKSVENSWKKGIVPEYYYWQLIHYMGVMDLDFAYICCCWGFTLNNTAVIRVERDKAVEKMLFESDKEFLRCVELGLDLDESKMPSVLLNKYYVRKYGVLKENKSDPVELPPKFKKVIKTSVDLRDQLAEAEAEVERIKEEQAKIANQLFPFLKDNNYAIFTDTDGVKKGIAVNVPSVTPKFDVETFKKECPREYRECINRNKTHKFSISDLRKLYPDLAVKYQPNRKVKLDAYGNIDGELGYSIYDYQSGEKNGQ